MNHEYYMQRAIALAKNGKYTARPNPMVGCVIVKNNTIIGEGFHEYFGGHHAEVNALKQAGSEAQDATCYITLEPCNHHGKTPPCVDALIQSGIKEAVIATRDPNPLMNGKSIYKLKAFKINIIEGILEQEAQDVNRAFFHRMQFQRPWVTLKLAISLDGKIADYQNSSQWISSSASRHHIQQLRAASDAIMIGSNTALYDNPQLSVRELSFIPNEQNFKYPKKIILDTQAKLSTTAKVFNLPGEVIIYTQFTSKTIYHKQAPLDKSSRLDLQWILHDLASQQVNHVLVEGGGKLAGALLEQNLINEIILFQCGLILGPYGKSSFELPGKISLSDAKRWKLIKMRRHEQDIMQHWVGC